MTKRTIFNDGKDICGTPEIGIIIWNYISGNLKVHIPFSPLFLLGLNPKIVSEIRTKIEIVCFGPLFMTKTTYMSYNMYIYAKVYYMVIKFCVL